MLFGTNPLTVVEVVVHVTAVHVVLFSDLYSTTKLLASLSHDRVTAVGATESTTGRKGF